MVDIGTFEDGWHAMNAAQIVGEDGWVVAIEMNQKSFLSMCRNVHINGLQNDIFCINAAVTNRITMNHTVKYDSLGSCSCIDDSAEDFAPSATLDDLVCAFQIRLVKIDAEGHEMNILMSGPKTLKKTDAFLIETCGEALHRNGHGVCELCDFMRENGFVANRIAPDGSLVESLYNDGDVNMVFVRKGLA
jgi:FkbM family methyltransferase